MRIGELARRAGVTPDTIRFYEHSGLLASPPRTPAGYRDYSAAVLEDLSFIRKGKALGLGLSEIGEVMAITADGQVPCTHVHSAISARLGEVERRITELQALRTALKDTLTRLDTTEASAPGCRCAVVEAQD